MSRTAKILVYTSAPGHDSRTDFSDHPLPAGGREYITDFASFSGKAFDKKFDLIVFRALSGMMDISRACLILANSVNQRTPLLITDNESDTGSVIDREKEPALRRTDGILRLKRKAERLDNHDLVETIITTAATLGHEINNPLMSISANTEMLLAKFDYLPKDVVYKLKSISNAADRIQDVLHKLTDLERLKYRRTPSGRMIDIEDENKSGDSRLPQNALSWDE